MCTQVGAEGFGPAVLPDDGVVDGLVRRSSLLFLDARLVVALAPRVSDILAEETGLPTARPDFLTRAHQYSPLPA